MPDDKIEAVVTVVLQAVDQRLATVREQLVQITNNIARGQAHLQSQIDDVRQLCIANADSPGPLIAGPDASAARQLVEAANVLTERVTFLEARVNQYTNDRVAELHTAIERLNSQLAGESGKALSGSPLSAAVPATSSTAPALSVAKSTVMAPSVAIPEIEGDDNIAPAAARLAPLAATPKLPRDPHTATAEPIDIEQLSAQMSERLSAAIERALGT